MIENATVLGANFTAKTFIYIGDQNAPPPPPRAAAPRPAGGGRKDGGGLE